MAEAIAQARVLNGGLVTGLPIYAIGNLESPDCQNIDPADPLGATTRPGSSSYQSIASAGSGLTTGIFPWTRNAGTFYAFLLYGSTIYSADGATALSVLTGIATDSIMQGAGLNNLAVIVASGVAPQVSTAGSTLAALGGTPPSLAKFVTIYAAKCWLAGDTANPSKVSFSKSGDPEDWTAANDAGSITVDKDDGDTIQGIAGTKRALYVWKRKNAYIITGESPFNFRADKLAAIGLVSQWGHATDGQGVFWASDDGIYYATGFSLARISDPVRETYLNISDKSTIALEVRGEKLFCFYKSSGASQNDQALVLAFKRKMSDGGVRGVWAVYTSQPYQAAKTGRDQSLYAVTNASTVQIYKLDTGTSGAVPAYWNTPDNEFDDEMAVKQLTRLFIHGRSPDATTTLTVRWYLDGASYGSDLSVSVGTTASSWVKALMPPLGLQARAVRARFSWTGQMTIYGWRMHADVRADGIPLRS